MTNVETGRVAFQYSLAVGEARTFYNPAGSSGESRINLDRFSRLPFTQG